MTGLADAYAALARKLAGSAVRSTPEAAADLLARWGAGTYLGTDISAQYVVVIPGADGAATSVVGVFRTEAAAKDYADAQGWDFTVAPFRFRPPWE
jgi:hypothetical protein